MRYGKAGGQTPAFFIDLNIIMQFMLPARAGISLKARHYSLILESAPDIGWFEIHPENYMGNGGAPHQYLTAIRNEYPISMHGVGMSLGSASDIDQSHLDALSLLVKRYQPEQISEHLSWSRMGSTYVNDLLPLPYNDESLQVMINNIDLVQTALGRKILIENPSAYLAFDNNEYSEPAFLNTLVKHSGCGLLLDVNNIFVSACNQGFDPCRYLSDLNMEPVEEIHLAGHAVHDIDGQEIRIDNHGSNVINDVWKLYETAIKLINKRAPTLIEWDTDVPELSVLISEMKQADSIMNQALTRSKKTVAV